MPAYTHDYIQITSEPVTVEVGFVGGIDKNYVATTEIPVALVKVMLNGVNITSSCFLESFNDAIGTVILFGTPSILTGNVIVDYTYLFNGIINTKTDELQPIIRYNVGGTKANYFVVKNFPIKEGSLVLKDSSNINKTSYITSISGQGREIVNVGSLESDNYNCDYIYDNGQAGSLWKDNYNLYLENLDYTAYITETNTNYSKLVLEAKTKLDITSMNYRLWLMRKILDLLPPYSTESAKALAIKTGWDANKSTYYNSSNYLALYNSVIDLRDTINLNAPADIEVVHTTACNKVYTYLAELSQIEYEEIPAGDYFNQANSARLDYNGLRYVSPLDPEYPIPDISLFTNGVYTKLASYSYTENYSLRLRLTNSNYVSKIEYVVDPLDIGINDIDNFRISLDTRNGPYEPSTVIQALNAGIVDLVKEEQHTYMRTKSILESLKDSDGAPIEKDSTGADFVHYGLFKKESVMVFKSSNMVNNYVCNFKLYKPSSEIVTILESIGSTSSLGNDRQRVLTLCTTFKNKYEAPSTEVIGAWQTNTPIDYGIDFNTGDVDVKEVFPGPYVHLDCTSTDGVNKNASWAYVITAVNAIISSDFLYTSDMSTIISEWSAELTAEGISTDAKVIESNYQLWKEKFDDSLRYYETVLNSKNAKNLLEVKNLKQMESIQLPPI